VAGRGFWWKFGGPFGFAFGWGMSPFWGRHGSFPTVEEEIEMLEEYKMQLEEWKQELEKEIAQVNEKIRRLRGDKG
jgi:hypothetical protein